MFKTCSEENEQEDQIIHSSHAHIIPTVEMGVA